MLGIVYRDLKPKNVLVRSDGHIMLTDFDLSLKCEGPTSIVAHLVSDLNPPPVPPPSIAAGGDASAADSHHPAASCILPSCIVPAVSCFHPKRRRCCRNPHWARRRSNGTKVVQGGSADCRLQPFQALRHLTQIR